MEGLVARDPWEKRDVDAVADKPTRKTHSNGMSGDASTVWDSPLIFNVTMIDLSTHPEKWSISTRPMSDKVYQRAALCVTAKFVCQ